MPTEPIDLEDLTRRLVLSKKDEKEILRRITEASGSEEWAKAILQEVKATEFLDSVTSKELKDILTYPRSGVSAGAGGLGCRGEGDFHIHNKIAQIVGKGGVIGVPEQDDSGIVTIDGKKGKKGSMVAVTIDGVHSRLDRFPFLMGFHVARAALRDLVVSGARPLALLADVHIGNDGDVGKVLDLTAGISTVGDALGFPLIAGSTLRIGGDMVLGERLTGGVGAVGVVVHLTPRKAVRTGDVLIMTEGAGGGTIATTALFNGMGNVVESTINLKTLRSGLALLGSKLINRVHSMTDVTNGGIRGDALHMASSSKVRIDIYQKAFLSMIEPKVSKMLNALDIDPLGVSIDSILLSMAPKDAKSIVGLFKKKGVKAAVVGKVSKGSGVFLILEAGKTQEMKHRFRESAYTPIKKVVDKPPHDLSEIKARIDGSALKAIEKKKRLLKRLAKNP
jgi:hydrogenase expression/formation protein